MLVRGGEGDIWALLLDLCSVLGFLDTPGPSWPKPGAKDQGETSFWVGHAIMSAADGQRGCSVALIWVRGQPASNGTFLGSTHAD